MFFLRHFRRVQACLALTSCICTAAFSSSAYADPSIDDFSLKLDFAEYKLPGTERMGMGSIGFRKEMAPNLSVGVDGHFALTGDRGGFITLGFGGEYEIPLTDRMSLELGLFVGAGGGRNGYYLTGGGLHLRETLGLTYKFGAPGSVTIGISQVDFPQNGRISSTQAFAAYRVPFKALFESGGETRSTWSSGSGSLNYSANRHEVAAVGRQFMALAGTPKYNNTPQEDFSVLGIDWRTYLNDWFYIKAETAGAMGGNSTGYMHILAGGGVRVPITKRIIGHVGLAVGGGGGGDVDTGGGFMVDTAAGLQIRLNRSWFLEFDAGYVTAPFADFKATSYTMRAGYQFGSFDGAGNRGPSAQVWSGHPLRVRAAGQYYLKGAEGWRTRPEQNVGNLGVQIDYLLTPNWYLTGQGLGAYTGDAGAYMIGLLGLGLRVPLGSKVFVEGEAMVGAAGGGGLAVGPGLVGQANLNLGYKLTPSLSLIGSAGYIKAFDGKFQAPVVGLALGYQFRMFTPQN